MHPPVAISLLLEPYRPPGGLTETLFLELLTLVAGYLAKRLEIALKRRLFTQLGGLQVSGFGGEGFTFCRCCGCYGSSSVVVAATLPKVVVRKAFFSLVAVARSTGASVKCS